MGRLSNFYTATGMLGKQKPLGELPTTGELYRSALTVAAPAMTDTVLVSLMALVDTVMVSVLGAAAIAAVGITTQPRMIIVGTFMALNTGLTAVVARRKGEDDPDRANRVMAQTLTLCAVLSVFFAILGGIYARPLLLFAGAQADVIDMAVAYFRIIMVGIPFSVVTVCINGAQRGCGQTKISMKINLTANLVNMLFNYLLIGGNLGFPMWGVAGAAVATTIGNVVGLVMAIASLYSRHETFLRLNLRNMLCLEKATLSPVVSVGLSAGVEQIFMRVGFFLYVKIIASLGTDVMAAHNICNSILNVAFGFCDGLGMAAAAFFGQSLGRKRPDLSILYCRACQRVSLFLSAFIVFTFTLFGRQLIHMFSTDDQIVALGVPVLLIIAITTPFQASQYIYSSCLRSAGDTRYMAVVSMVSVGLLRPIICWVLCYPLGGGLVGAWLSYLVDQLGRVTLSWLRIRRGGWKKIKL